MLQEVFTTDNIAIYGAFVATLAFGMSVFQYRASIKDKQIQLNISYRKHPDFDSNITALKTEAEPWENVSITPLYVVTVSNLGNVSAFINEVFVISSDRERHDALIRNNHFMDKISNIEILPKSSKDFHIYFSEQNIIFDLEECIVIDATGKKWKGKFL